MNFIADREFQMTKNDKIGNKNGKVEILKKSDKIDENAENDKIERNDKK